MLPIPILQRPIVFCALTVCLFNVFGCTAVKTQSAVSHDMACIAAMAQPGLSPDQTTRSAAAATATYYLGRLDQKGLTLEQINKGVEEIALSPEPGAKVHQKEFVNLCASDVNARVRGLKALSAADLAKMRNGVPH